MKTIWPKLIDSNVNTVLANVSWEDIEPIEGGFNFSKLDTLMQDARSHNLHLVLLWFGAFKNGTILQPHLVMTALTHIHREVNLRPTMGQDESYPVSSHDDRQQNTRLRSY